ncbi:MAG TPA: hypothetical protein VK588_06685 [Chitinophagaceae bacterium]|nr:hypothetical protein [Chitinophagaceae bacterium]
MDFLSPEFKKELIRFIGQTIEDKFNKLPQSHPKDKQQPLESEYLTKRQACVLLGNISLSNLNSKLDKAQKEGKVKKKWIGGKVLLKKIEWEKLIS